MDYALSNEVIRKIAPSVFATEPWGEVSDRYAFIPTVQVVDALRNEGFIPTRVEQSASRIEGKESYTKHMLRFRRIEDIERDGKDREHMPEIVLVNSHDRTSSYQLNAGVYRKVCANGLIAFSDSFGGIKINHSGNIVDDVIEGSCRIIEEVPQLMDSIEAMRAVELPVDAQIAYARSALALRYDEDDKGNLLSPITPEQLLIPRRAFDKMPDLWSTFNRVQENMLKGGQRGRNSKGGRTSTRAVKSVSEDARLNKALWYLAETMQKLAS